ncbi:MAG: HI0074 family nucleotidyltransferase substrate-binding subunit [Alphaproteobacteria bacterium]
MQRFLQRFDNYNKAIENLFDTNEEYKKQSSKFMAMALIQAFEISFELAWKVQKDYLNYLGFDVNGPREVIKKSFNSEIIKNGDVWLDMLEARNLTTHLYDEIRIKDIASEIVDLYINEFSLLKEFFESKV